MRANWQEGEEDEVELFEAGEDATKAFESTEEPFYFIAFLVEGTIIFPRAPMRLDSGRDNWNHAEIENQLPGQVILVGFVHQQGKSIRHRPKFL